MPEDKSPEVHTLASGRDRVRVFTGLDHRPTLAETIVLATRPIQRMTRLRQTGLAFLVYPTSEQTRMAHCLGTTYWVATFIESMRTNDFAGDVGDGAAPAGSRARLAQLDAQLGPDLSFDLLARLFALIHDSDLLPLGHTLSHQLGHYDTPGQATRFQRYIDRVRAEVVESSGFAEIEDDRLRAAAVTCLLRHLDAVEAIAALREVIAGGDYEHPRLSRADIAALLPAGLIIDDLVTSTVSADLLDFALRDTLGAGMPWNFDTRLLESVCTFATPVTDDVAVLLKEHGGLLASTPHIYRFGLNARREGGRAHEVTTAVISLLRVRYEVLERIVYHRRKCAADAMVDRAIRNIGERFRSTVTEETLLRIGDDEFLDLVAREESTVAFPDGTGPAMPDLLAGRLFAEVYRLTDWTRLSDYGRSAAEAAESPAHRTEVEERVVASVPGLRSCDIVFSSRPLSMQLKEPDTLIGWDDGATLPLAEIARGFDYATEALGLTDRYASLWSLSIYLRAGAAPAIRDRVRLAAAELLER